MRIFTIGLILALLVVYGVTGEPALTHTIGVPALQAVSTVTTIFVASKVRLTVAIVDFGYFRADGILRIMGKERDKPITKITGKEQDSHADILTMRHVFDSLRLTSAGFLRVTVNNQRYKRTQDKRIDHERTFI